MSPSTTAEAFVNAINRHDLDTLTNMMSDQHRFVDSLGTVIQGRETMRNGWAGYFRMVPDYSITVVETYTSDSVVVMLGTAQGTYAKDGQLKPEDAWQTPVACRAQIQNEQVCEWRVYADNEPIRRLMAQR